VSAQLEKLASTPSESFERRQDHEIQMPGELIERMVEQAIAQQLAVYWLFIRTFETRRNLNVLIDEFSHRTSTVKVALNATWYILSDLTLISVVLDQDPSGDVGILVTGVNSVFRQLVLDKILAAADGEEKVEAWIKKNLAT
jgi:hypothetical protein